MERDSKTTESNKRECTTNNVQMCTRPGEYTFSDFVARFKLPALVTVITGYHSENNEEDFSLASGQKLKVHAEHKNGTIVATTFNKEPRYVYIPMDCCQLVELRPNGIKDFFDDQQITFQAALRHFQFPLFVQFVDYKTDDPAVAGLYSRVLRLERLIKDEMVLCSTMQNDKTFLHIIPRNLDIIVAVNQDTSLSSTDKSEKEYHIYEEIKVNDPGHYAKLINRVDSFQSSSEMEHGHGQFARRPKQNETATDFLVNFDDEPEEESRFYNYPDLSKLSLPEKRNSIETNSAFRLRTASECDQTTGDISKLSVIDVSALLCSHNLDCFAEQFKMEEIDGNMLKDLDEEALKALGLNAFQTKKLLKVIQGWRPKLSSC